MSQWKDLLKEIAEIEEKYGGTLRNPATNAEISNMVNEVHQKFENIVLPDTYVNFLKEINGLDFNGLVFYGVDERLLEQDVEEEVHGFIEMNELWYENDWQRQYIFFGDSDTAWYCYNSKENNYVELDKPSGTLIQSFESFDSMLYDALKTVLL